MTPTRSTPVIGYARVSTTEQGDSGLGLDAQEAAIRRHCEARDLIVLEVVREVASGASYHKRSKLNEAMARLEAKDGPEAIVVAKLDRLTRSVADGARLFERAKAKGWGIIALDLGVDTTTPSGELVANVMVAVGQWERRVISQRTSDALRAKVARGEKIGAPRVIESDDPSSRERASRSLERVRDLRGAGLSYQAISDTLTAEGLPSISGGPGGWSKKNVYKTCKRYGIDKGE